MAKTDPICTIVKLVPLSFVAPSLPLLAYLAFISNSLLLFLSLMLLVSSVFFLDSSLHLARRSLYSFVFDSTIRPELLGLFGSSLGLIILVLLPLKEAYARPIFTMLENSPYQVFHHSQF